MLQRHAGEGETIAEAIRDCLDYGKDPEKTESGKYISAYECDPATVADEFLLAKASYAAMTGREQKKENDVLCYQIRQSFYPGEITPKEANRIGYELAMRWTKGRHAFIVTTHTDKQHIHCHIYYNSTTLDCTRKFRNFWGSSFALRRLSDRLCLENGLSIVENPKPRSKGKYRNYGEWQKERKGPLSYQDRLRLAIDTVLAKHPVDLDEFLALMKRAGYEVKTVRGGGISFRLTGQGQERFTRLRASTLGDGYDLQDVLAAIEGKEKRPGHSERKISLAVDIQAKLAAGKGPGYERWAKVFNIKQMAAALAYIQDNGLTDYEQLAQKATEAADRFHAISEQVKQTEQAMKTNAGLKAATVQYAKTRPVFEQYKATKYSRKFLAEHEADLELYRAAQAEMRSLLGGAKLPKMDVLKEEGRKLTAKKKQLYGELARESDLTKQICYDINEIAMSSQSRLIQQKQSEQAYKRLMTSLSHDVKTPLASLVGYLEAVESKMVTGAEQEEYIRVAMEKAHYLKDFVTALFEWVKLDAGEQIFHFEVCDLNELSRDIMADWVPLLENHDLSYEIEIPETEYMTRVDSTAYTRILNNLLQNILTHSDASKVFLTVTETEQQAKIVVADNGNGIAASDLPHIFERMYQCDHSRSAKGNGLGLSIAKELVSIHKGTITAASVPGNGTTFIIILPKAL